MASYSIREQLAKKYGNPTEATTDSGTKSVRDTLAEKYSNEAVESRINHLNDWGSRYNSLMDRVSGYGGGWIAPEERTSMQTELDSLISGFDEISEYASRLGMTDANKYLSQAQSAKDFLSYYDNFYSEDEYNALNMDSAGMWGKMFGGGNLDRDIGYVRDLIETPYDRATYERVYGAEGADLHDAMKDERQYIEDTYGIQFTDDYDRNERILNELLKDLDTKKNSNADSNVAYTTEDGQNVSWESLYDYRWAQENDTGAKRLQWYKDAQDKLAQLKQNGGSQAEIAALKARIQMYERGEYMDTGKVVDEYGRFSNAPDFLEMSEDRSFTQADRDAAVNDTNLQRDISYVKELIDSPYDRDHYEQLYGSGADMYDSMKAAREHIENAYGIRLGDDAAQNRQQLLGLLGTLQSGSGDKPEVKDRLGLYLNESEEEYGAFDPETIMSVMDEGAGGNWDYLTDDEVKTYYYLMNTQGEEAAYKFLDDMAVELGRRKYKAVTGEIDKAGFVGRRLLGLATIPMNFIGNIAAPIGNIGDAILGDEYNPYATHNLPSLLGGYIRETNAEKINEVAPWRLPLLEFSAGDVYQAIMSGADSALGAAVFGKAYTPLMGTSAATSEATRLYQEGASGGQIILGASAAGAAEMIFEKYSIDNLVDMKAPGTGVEAFKNVLIQGGIEATEEAATELANIIANHFVMQTESDWQEILDENGGDYGKAVQEEIRQIANAALGGFVSGSGSAVATQAGAVISNKAEESRIRDYAGAALTDLGETENVNEIAAAIGRQATGRALSDRDIALISGSENAQNILQMLGAKPVVTSEEVNTTVQRLVNLGMGNAQAQVTAEKLISAGKNYGKQSNIFVENYIPGQSVEEYRLGFDQLYTMGREGMNKSLMTQYGAGLQQSQKEIAYLAGQNDSEGNKDAKVNLEDDTLDVNADGKTIRTDTNEDIEPTGFESVGENGMLSTKGGQSVSIRSVAFASFDDAVLYKTIAKVASSPTIANTLLKQFRAQNSLSAIDFAAALMEAYEAGQIGDKTALELKDAEFAGKLTTGQREAVYNRGKRAAYQKAYQRKQNVKKNSGGKKDGKLHFDRKGRKFDSVRESSLAVMDTLSKALGVDIYVYESFVNEKGQRVYLSDRGEKKAPNGYYDPADGSIHIDLNAGQDGKGTMLFTVAHELTHFIKDWSRVKYMALADALVKQYQKQGVSVSELVDNQIAKAKQNGREMSRPEAFDEVVADSMESMLSDENAAAFLERLAKRDKGLKEKIVSWLKDLAAKLKNALSAYKDVKPDSPEGKMVAEMEDFRKEIMGIYTSALVDAGENFRENGGNKNTTREGGVRYSIKFTKNLSWEDQIKGALYGAGKIRRNDTLVVGSISYFLTKEGVSQKPLAIPLSVLSKAMSGKDVSHSIKRGKLAKLNSGIKNAPIVIVNPSRNAIVYVTDIKQGGFPIIAAFDMNTVFDGDHVHKATSIHLQIDVQTMLENLPESATLYVKDKNELDAVGATNNLRGLAANIKFISEIVTQDDEDVKQKKSDRVSGGYGSMTYAEISAEQQRIIEEERGLQEQERNLSSSPELLDAMDSYMNLGDDLKNLLRGKRAGDATQEEINRIDEVKKLREDALKHIADIQESTGLNDVSRRLDSIREEKKALRKAADEAWAREGAEKENKAIKKSGLTAEEYFRKKAIKEFHFTTNFNEAGYLLPDGRMLNFSGGERNHRYRDHREIGTIYEATQGAAALNRFMSDGNIRIMAESPGIDITVGVEPTPEQYDAIRKFVNSHGSRERQFFVDFSDKDGSPAGKYSYEGAVRADRVINDIKYFYENGTTREQSDLHLFLSDRDPTAEATRAALEKENGKLREDVSRLRELLRLQGKVTGGTVMKPSSVEAAARWLNKYAGAKADVKELSRMLTDFYRFLATDKEYSWEDVQQRAMVISRYLQDNVQLKPQISDYARDVLREVRGTKITLDESQRAEVEKLYGSYEAFRKAAFGNVTFVKEGGISLDSKWHEWASLYPGTFDSEITATDQPQALMDAIDTLRNSDTTVMEYAYNRESIAQDLAVAVYDSYWRVDALKTVADRDQRKINKLRSEHRTEMDKLKEERDKTVAELKQKRQEEMKKLRTDYRKKLEDTRTRYQESREKAVDSRNRTKMREQVKKTVNELNHLLLDGDKKRHVPESMRKAVAEILSAVNMETSTAEARSAAFERTVARYNQRIKLENDPAERARLEAARDAYIGKGDQFKAKIDALAKAYEDIKNSADPGLQDAYSDAVSQYLFTLEARVGDTSLGDMTLDQLRTVQEVLRIVLSTIRNANRSFLNERAGTIEQQAKRCIFEVSSVWRKKKEGESGAGRWLRGFHYRNLKPIYLMRAIGSNALTEAYNNLRRGEDIWYRDIQGGREFFLSQSGKYGYEKWDFEKATPFTDDSGGQVKLTLGQIMSLYAHAKQGDDTAEHLRLGGVVLEGEPVKVNKLGIKIKYHLNDATPHQIGQETLAEIIGTLTKEQRAFADEMQDYLSTVMADKGNEVSLAMYGIKLFTKNDYFPIKSAKQYVNQKNEPVGEVKLKNSGFTNKRKPESNNPIILRDFMDVWADHVTEMSNYHAFVLAIEDFNRIINYQTARKEEIAPVSMEQTIQNYMGKEAVSAVKELIQSVNGGARVDPAATFVSKAINLVKKAAVFASLSVVIQQPSSIVRAEALIDPKYFAGRTIDREKVDPTWEIIKKYAPVAGIKEMGYFDTNMGKSTVDYIKGPEHDGVKGVLTGIVKREKGSFDELFSMTPGYADKVTWCAIWEAVKRETAAKHPKLATRSEEFLKICGERFTEVITQTQVYDSVFARSGNMRSKDKLMGMATSFMAEPTTAINMIYDAVLQGTRGNKAYMKRAIGAVIGAAVLNAVLKSIVYAERDEDEDETFAEKYVSALVAALKDDVLFLVPNSIPFVRDIMSLVQGYSVERMDMELADDLISAVKKLHSDKASSEEKILGILGSFGNLLFPAKNMIREVRALYSTIQNAFRNRGNTTAYGLSLALREGFTGKTESNGSQLYEARVRGDTAHEERVTTRYENENAANSAVVQEIGRRFNDGLLSREEAVDHLSLYAGKTESEAYWMVREWAYAAEHGSTDGYSKYNELYDAILSGGDITESVREFTDHGTEEDSVMSNLKTQVGRWYYDSESEIQIDEIQARDILSRYFGMKPGEIDEVVGKWNLKKDTGISFDDLHEAMSDGKLSREEAVEYLQRYGGLTGYDAEERVEGWEFEDAHGYAYSDIKSTYLDEEITAEEALAVLVEIGGESQDDARKLMREWDYEAETGVNYSDKASQYRRGIITRQQLRQALMDLGGYSGEDADLHIEAYDWQNDGYQGASFARVKSWHEYCEPAGVSRDMWLKIALYHANTENDKREDGSQINFSAMKKVMAEIHKLPISRDQKTAIARALGWSERNIARFKPW